MWCRISHVLEPMHKKCQGPSGRLRESSSKLPHCFEGKKWEFVCEMLLRVFSALKLWNPGCPAFDLWVCESNLEGFVQSYLGNMGLVSSRQ